MTKRKAIVKFCVICFLVLLGVGAIFADFRIPTTNQRFVGFWGAIESKMGIDLKGGVLAVFNCEPNEGSDEQPTIDDIIATENRLMQSLTKAGLTEATVQHQGQQGSWKIRVEVPGLKETDEIFSAIGNPAVLQFKDEKDNVCVEGTKHISSVEIYQNPQTFEFGVLLKFTNDGGKAFREMIQNADQYTYIYRNGEKFSTVSVGDKSAGKDNTAVITLGKRNDGSMPSQADAEEFRLQIQSGLFSVKLSNTETSIISPTLGEGALIGCIIALLVGIVFMFGFMFWRYGDLGLLSNFLSVIVFLITFLLSLAIVNAVQLTLPGIAGIVLSFAMAVDANIIIFERIKDEYRMGRRLSVACKNGFDKSFWTIFDANITTVIGAGVLFFLGTGPIKGFAITLMLGVLISMFCSLVITRSFTKLYLVINPKNANRMKLENNNPYITETPVVTAPVKAGKRSLNLGDKKI